MSFIPRLYSWDYRDELVVALGWVGSVQNIWGLFPMWSMRKSSGPFHLKMMWQRHVSCTLVYRGGHSVLLKYRR